MELFYALEKTDDIASGFAVRLLIGTRQGHLFYPDKNKRQLSLPVVQSLASPVDRHILQLLMKECKGSVDDALFAVGKSQGKKVLKAIQLSGKFLWKGELLIYQSEKSGQVRIIGESDVLHLEVNGRRVSKEDCFSDGQLILAQNGVLTHYLSPFPKRLFNYLEKPLSADQIKACQFDYEDEVPFYLVDQRFKKEVIFPTPRLKLKDRTGAFADLYFDYRGLQINASDPQTYGIRQPGEEKLWEEDLLKTGYTLKPMAQSRYYCPVDQVGRSLHALIDCGWRIDDTYDKQLVKASATSFVVDDRNEATHLCGHLDFNGTAIPLSDIYGAFCRRQSFLQLDDQRVGLIDFTPFALWDQAGIEVAVEGSGLKMHRAALGFVKDYFPMDSTLPSPYRMAIDENPLSLFSGFLYPYQEQGVNWLSQCYRQGRHALLADEMGLGKTIQAIAFLTQLSKARSLIIVPSSLIVQWQIEFMKFYPSADVIFYHGKNRSSIGAVSSGIILTTYGMVREQAAEFAKIDYDVVILDEAQVIKNSDSLTYQAVKKLRSRFRLNITGTPVENSLEELHAHFDYLMPGFLKSRFNGQSPKDQLAVSQLKKLVAPYILKRTKDQVLRDLPEKLEQTVWVEMSQEQRISYEEVVRQLQQSRKRGKLTAFETILRLRQHCCSPQIVDPDSSIGGVKCERVVDDVMEMIRASSKVIIFSAFVSMLHRLRRAFEDKGVKILMLDGSTSNRQALVDQFQHDPSFKLFLISVKAGGVGLNLTAADHVVIYDPWWNDAVENQAIDRAHRIGRDKKLMAWRYMIQESIEEKMMKLKARKRNLVDKLFDEEEFFQELWEEEGL